MTVSIKQLGFAFAGFGCILAILGAIVITLIYKKFHDQKKEMESIKKQVDILEAFVKAPPQKELPPPKQEMVIEPKQEVKKKMMENETLVFGKSTRSSKRQELVNRRDMGNEDDSGYLFPSQTQNEIGQSDAFLKRELQIKPKLNMTQRGQAFQMIQ